MDSDWSEVALGDVVTLQLSSVDKKSKPSERGVQLCNYMDVYANNFIRRDMDFMAATATTREILNCSLFPGDVVITKDSEKHDDIGIPALIREHIPDLVCGYHLAILRPNVSVLDGTYLFYALSADDVQRQFHSYANGVTRFGLRKADIGLVNIPVPPLPEQRAIAHVLGTLDDKIELNRRMNQTLEEMARAIFQDWFVDFGPVRAKMEGRDPYLPPELWDLFPDRLVDSELGEIPEGWDVKPISECFNLTMGQSPPGSTYNDNGEGLPFFQGSTDFGSRFPQKRKFCSAPTRTAEADDTLLSVRAPVGTLNMAWEKCCIGRGLATIRHKSGSSPFTYYSAWAIQAEFQQYEQTGTVFGAITKKQLEAVPTISPPDGPVSAFGKLVTPLEEMLRNRFGESQSLTKQRDTLLPRLLSEDITAGEGRQKDNREQS